MSRFVSGGTISFDSPSNDPVESSQEQSKDEAKPEPGPEPSTATEWEAVEAELAAERRARTAARAAGSGERSLFEVLQANKEAKQAAFEDRTRLRNQFRALDPDEISFLDDVQAARRAEEDRVFRETEAGLRAFRAARRLDQPPGAESSSADGPPLLPPMQMPLEDWVVGRKRRRLRAADAAVKPVRAVKRLAEDQRQQRDQVQEAEEKKEGEEEQQRQEEENRRLQDGQGRREDGKATRAAVASLVEYGSDSDG